MCLLKSLITFIITLCLVTTFTLTAHAEIITIEVDGSYNMGKNDSQAFAEESAYQDALSRAADQAGVHVESYSETHNFKLTKYEVRATSDAILNVIDKKFDYTTIENQAFKVICHIKVEADTSKIDALMADKRNLGQSASLERQVANLQQEVAQLREDAANRAELERQYLIKAYEKNLYNAFNNKSNELIKHYINEIRQLDPTNVMTQYVIFWNYDKQYAINDALNILKIDPDNYMAYITLALKDDYDKYASKAIQSVRRHFTPDEIKKMTLVIIANAEVIANAKVIYPNYYRKGNYTDNVIACMINILYGTKNCLIISSPDEVQEFINKFKQENNINFDMSDLTDVLISYSYFEDEV
ncbi:MAG: hypothetical protein IJ563_08590 [Selenomonadaceae bacterium]|nr:hypothetical protein [Selenomonadaceae bacterium]